MKLVIIFGPPACGKMTVGQELSKISELKLFHNHMSLELVNQFFDFGTPDFRALDKAIRFDIFKAIAKSDLQGLIFTMVWAVNLQEDEDYIDDIINIFKAESEISPIFVELYTELEERLKRNKNDHRLKHKPSKRDIAFSEKALLSYEDDYQLNTKEGDLPNKVIFKIDNTNLSAAEAAQKIKAQFDL